jgi:hypothetical protein
MVFPVLTHWWLRLISVIYIFRIFLLTRKFPYGKEIPNFSEIFSRLFILAVYFGAVFLLYKIITRTLNFHKKKGAIIIIFSLGPLFAFFGLEAAVISLIFGFYAVIFNRLSAGLNLSKKVKRIVLAVLCIGVIISLPQVFRWGNLFGNSFLYNPGGAWYGFIIIAFSLFLIETAISLIFPFHHRTRVIITLILTILISSYGIINGLNVPTVKEIVIPLKKLPADTPDFTIVQWSDTHIGDIVSYRWLIDTIAKTNALKPDLIVITGDMIDIGFKEKYIDALKQLKAKFGILAVTGNHEYYFKRISNFHEIADKAGIRVLCNEFITLPNGIQIAGINDPTAQEFGDQKPSVTGAIKNSDSQKPIILLSHQTHFFYEAAQQGIDLQLSGHNHMGQLPLMDIFIYLTIKYSYGLYREGNSYIYTSCGTGLWAIPMRISTRGEITKIILKRK